MDICYTIWNNYMLRELFLMMIAPLNLQRSYILLIKRLFLDTLKLDFTLTIWNYWYSANSLNAVRHLFSYYQKKNDYNTIWNILIISECFK